MGKKNKGKKKSVGPKTMKPEEAAAGAAVAAPASQRSSDRLNADAPEWSPSSCFTAEAAPIVEDTPSPPPPPPPPASTQGDSSPVEAVAAAASASAAAADAATFVAAVSPSCPEGEGEGEKERELPQQVPTVTAANGSLKEEHVVQGEASPTASATETTDTSACNSDTTQEELLGREDSVVPAAAAAAPVATTSSAVPIETEAQKDPPESREAEGDASAAPAAAAAATETASGCPSEGSVSAAAATATSGPNSFEAAPTTAVSQEEVVGGGDGGAARPGVADAIPAEAALTGEAIFKISEDCARVSASASVCTEGDASFARKGEELPTHTTAAVEAPPHKAASDMKAVAAEASVGTSEAEATVVCAAEVVPTTDAATATTADYPSSVRDAKTGVASGGDGVGGGVGGGGGGGIGDGGGGADDGRSKAEEAFYRGAAKEVLGADEEGDLVRDAESTDEATDRTEDGGSDCCGPVAPSKVEVDGFLSDGKGKNSGGDGRRGGSGGGGRGFLANPRLRWGIAAVAAVTVVVIGVSRGRRSR